MTPLDAALLLVVGVCVLASLLRGLVRGVLFIVVLVLIIVFSPLGKSQLWLQSKAAGILSQLAVSWHIGAHKAPATERFIRADKPPSEQLQLGHTAVKGDNDRAEQQPRQKTPDDGARWPEPLPETAPNK